MAGSTGIKIGDVVEAEVFKITSFGAFVKMASGKRGFIHISQVSENFVKDISAHLKLGSRVKARILNIDGPKIDLSLKKLKEETSFYPKGKEYRSSTFEDKLDVFLQQSKERLSDLQQNTQSKQY